ncbi:Cell division suppressor protein YneA [bioreactor metagenome]|uniref:Cell division suppressor protein YneA n=1 Tax=bioreactor metagenome TaxID=1076179 RepID=A0A644T8V4_9ZZZZ|nr:LysM domain-containing protein [Negativicutes bacterium]
MRILLVISILILCWGSAFSAQLNPYKDSNHYEIVHVQSGDTVWNISAQYVSDSEDIRDLVFAITKLNQLNNNAQVHPGQILKIPQKAKNSVAFK